MQDIESILFKEAQSRIAPAERLYSYHLTKQEQAIVDSLLKEAQQRLEEIRLQKEGMAAQVGVKDVRNSWGNIQFLGMDFLDDNNQIVNKKDYMKGLEENVYAAFRPFFYTRSDGKKLPIRANPKMAFRFKRTLIPVEPESQKNAMASLDEIERAVPGFKTFVKYLESSSIPVNPFFHKTVRSQKMGGVNSQQATSFIQSEAGRPLMLPNGQKPQGHEYFYREHLKRIQSGESINMTTLINKNRKFTVKDLDSQELNTPSYLLKGLKNKIRQGYWINWSALKADIKKMEQEKSTKNPANKASYKAYYASMYQNIMNAFNQAFKPLTQKDNADEWFDFGILPGSTKTMRGLKVTNKNNKHLKPDGLSTRHLKLVLKHLTDYNEKRAQIPTTVGKSDFLVPAYKMPYCSNGLDSDYKNPETNMLVVPQLRRKPDGSVGYDTDQCNIGRAHLIYNGDKIESFLMSDWAKWCDQSLKKLYSIKKSRKRVGPTVDAALSAVLFNRTNAENIISILSTFRSFPEFKSQFLSRSLASEYTQGEGHQDTAATMETTFGRNPQAYERLKAFGYQMSKMMDIVSAIVHSACKETVQFDDGTTGNFYGRFLSTATGKSNDSTILIGIRYAGAAPQLASDDPELQEIVDKYRAKHQISPKDGEYIRQTRHPEKAQELPQAFQHGKSIYRVIYDLRFFVGLATSQADFKKAIGSDDYMEWDQAVNALFSAYPQIEQEFGRLFEPMHANLSEMSTRFQNAMKKIQKEMSTTQDVEIVVEDRVQNKTDVIGKSGSQTVDTPTTTTKAQPPPPSSSQDQNVRVVDAPGPLNGPNPTPQPTPQGQDTSAEPAGVGAPAVSDPLPKNKAENPNFVGRQKGKRSLVRNRPNPNSGKLRRSSLVENLVKIADKLDETGRVILASKIDLLLNELAKRDTVNVHQEIGILKQHLPT